MTDETNREIDATRFWAKILLGALLIPTITGFIWAGKIETRLTQVERQTTENKNDLRTVSNDLRDILIGIEQVKARLGIVEIEK